MKKIVLRLFTIFITSVVFFSCSKENLTLGKSSETISTAKMGPVYNYGGIAGTLTPTPDFAALKFYHVESNFATSCFADQEGRFKIGSLIPGIYRIMVIYIPKTPVTYPEQEFKYFEIQGVLVEGGSVTELDDIVLIPK